MYKKQCFVFHQNKPVICTVRSYTSNDFDELIRIQEESFPPPFPSELLWSKDQLNNHVSLFPDGALCVEIDGTICGSITSAIVSVKGNAAHTWDEVTGSGYIHTHDPSGNTLYVVDVCVTPSHRSMGLGKLLLQSLYEVVIHYKLERLLGGCRIPGYAPVSSLYTPVEYMNLVSAGTLYDPVMTFLMRCGRTPIGLAANYIEDEDSHNYAVLMEWKNPFYTSIQKEAGTKAF
ncbi:GNAT family N-acetyltransferase [Priestia aryabhattai]|uniref:GNAT family N-acetyltransferase n=1 Tax=Priestia aryabhattai TaxID=412384 RepID=UPI002E1EEB4C|nr:GNAT family N-acetyltransferase [Priestia aryabhattai]